jgi:predicted RNA-binding Zn ribbon-like protein
MIDTLKNTRISPQLGGHLTLNFINTAEFRHTDAHFDGLKTYLNLLVWCYHSSLLTDTQAEGLLKRANTHPDDAEDALAFARQLREALYRIFVATFQKTVRQADDLTLFNAMLRTVSTQRQVVVDGYGFAWDWLDNPGDLTRVLWTPILSAAELLTSEEVSKVKQCPNCGWLFLDTSRNGLRRWCSMDFCGSKMKSRRQYQRRLQAQDNPS